MVFILALLLIQTPQLLLPDVNGAWTVEVTTSGGILGTGAGDFGVSSEGRILCSREVKCPSIFKPADIQPLMETIQGLTRPIPPPASFSLCRDCITRTIKITWRDLMGVFHSFTATFDDTTKGNLPPEVAKLHDAVVALGK